MRYMKIVSRYSIYRYIIDTFTSLFIYLFIYLSFIFFKCFAIDSNTWFKGFQDTRKIHLLKGMYAVWIFYGRKLKATLMRMCNTHDLFSL